MLPSKNRLKKKKDFEQVFKRGKSFQDNALSLKLTENNLKVSRFGFVVGLKVSKKAFLRNKIRRRLREIVKIRLPQTKTGLDVVLIVGQGFIDKDFQETVDVVNKLFKKAEI